jgi:transcriptional regulator with XRE-family HTH domain
VNEAQRWVEFGHWLVEQRERIGLNRRDAAKRAGISLTAWKDMESGYKTAYGGVRVLPNLGEDVLEKVATALELSADEVMKHVGRINSKRSSGTPKATSDAASRLVQKIVRLDERDRRLIEHLVNEMLGES